MKQTHEEVFSLHPVKLTLPSAEDKLQKAKSGMLAANADLSATKANTTQFKTPQGQPVIGSLCTEPTPGLQREGYKFIQTNLNQAPKSQRTGVFAFLLRQKK